MRAPHPRHALALAAWALAAVAAASAVPGVLPGAAAIPDVRHVNVAFLESGCDATEWCLRLDPPDPVLTWGEQVEFVLLNPASNAHPHNLQVQSFGSRSDVVPPGEEKYLLLTARQSGEFAIFSSVRGDREKGMEATFTVVDPSADKTQVKVPAPGVAGAALAVAAATGLLGALASRSRGDRARRGNRVRRL